MDKTKRLHRQDPARSAPLRNFSGIFRPETDPPPAKAPTPNGSANSAATPAAHDEPVGLAYRVIEKYISEGKQHAGLFNGQPYQTSPMTDGFQELLERTIRFQNEMLPLFIEALTSAVKMAPTRTPEAAPSAPHPRSSPPHGDESKAISIEVASARPVQISIDLKENSEKLPLVTLGLRTVEPGAPVLGNLTLIPETSENPLQLRVSIADGFPAGLYSGVIVHRVTGEVRGTLTVRIAT